MDLSQLEFDKTTRGAPCIMYENYKFRCGNKMREEIRWRCTNKMCKATIKTNGNRITEKRTEHDHEPFTDRGKRVVKKLKKGNLNIEKKISLFLLVSEDETPFDLQGKPHFMDMLGLGEFSLPPLFHVH